MQSCNYLPTYVLFDKLTQILAILFLATMGEREMGGGAPGGRLARLRCVVLCSVVLCATPLLWLRCVVLCSVVLCANPLLCLRPDHFFYPILDPILLLATIGGHLVVGGLQPLCCGSGYGNGCEEVSPCQRGRRMRPRDNSCQLNPLPDAIQNILRLMGK